jgi:uncharacterized protein (DUF433 family)
MNKKKARSQKIGRYLVIDPEVCHGKLTFEGTRVPVSSVLTALSMGDSIEQVMESWPRVSREAVLEALHLAADLVAKQYNGKVKRA